MSAVKKAMFPYAPTLADSEVREALPNGVFRLDDGSSVRVAASCLLRPQVGDRVLLAAVSAGDAFILAVLERNGASAQLEVAGVQQLQLSAPQVQIAATEAIEMKSLCDIELTAATGKLSLNARHLLTTVSDTLIENVKQYIAHVETYALKARAMLRMHSRDAIVTADKDVKIDAERISMG